MRLSLVAVSPTIAQVRRCGLLLLVVVLGACGSGGALIKRPSLPRLVLQQKDLPRGFGEFASGPQVRADFHPGPREDPTRFGRVGGWIARYRRADAASVRV